jgi:alpha-tubulin suppressor-like RCC1 family protein
VIGAARGTMALLLAGLAIGAGCARSHESPEEVGERLRDAIRSRCGSACEGPLAEVAGARSHACARYEAGGTVCWGKHRGSSDPRPVPGFAEPVAIEGPYDAIDIATTYDDACLVRRNGEVWCWGDNEHGEAGIGRLRDPQPVPVQTDPAPPATSLGSGVAAFCAVTADGRVLMWGRDFFTTPVLVDAVDDAVQCDVDAGGRPSVCARIAGGSVACAGDNDSGQLGDGTMTARETFAPVHGVTDAVDVAVSDGGACVVHADGGVSCWGHNPDSALGTGSEDEFVLEAERVLAVQDAVAVEMGDGICARTRSGALLCWGDSHHRHFGFPVSTVALPAPMLAPGVDAVLDAAIVDGASIALRVDGRVVTWGGSEDSIGGRPLEYLPLDPSEPSVVLGLP